MLYYLNKLLKIVESKFRTIITITRYKLMLQPISHIQISILADSYPLNKVNDNFELFLGYALRYLLHTNFLASYFNKERDFYISKKVFDYELSAVVVTLSIITFYYFDKTFITKLRRWMNVIEISWRRNHAMKYQSNRPNRQFYDIVKSKDNRWLLVNIIFGLIDTL